MADIIEQIERSLAKSIAVFGSDVERIVASIRGGADNGRV